MAHIVAAPCNDCKYTDCCVVCPVECFYQDEMMLYIDPEDCIDCEACVPECPVEAIFAEANVPAQWTHYTALNAEHSAALKTSGGPLARCHSRGSPAISRYSASVLIGTNSSPAPRTSDSKCGLTITFTRCPRRRSRMPIPTNG